VLKNKPQTGVVTPGTVILNALVREMKSAGLEYISVKDLEKALTKK
jgi:hypothetical protein